MLDDKTIVENYRRAVHSVEMKKAVLTVWLIALLAVTVWPVFAASVDVRNASGSRVGYIDGNDIRNASGSRRGYVDGSTVRNASGSRIGYVDGNDIRNASGSRVGYIDGNDIRNASGGRAGYIDGGASKAQKAAAGLILLLK